MGSQGEKDQPPAVRVTNLHTVALWSIGLYVAYRLIDAISMVALIFTMAFMLAIALDAPVRWLDRHGFSRARSVSALVLLGLVALGVGGYFAFRPVAGEVHEMIRLGPAYSAGIEARLAQVAAPYPFVADAVRRSGIRAGHARVAGWLLPHVGRLSLGMVGLLAASAAVLMIALYAVADPKPLVRGFVMAFPTRHRRLVLRIFVGVTQQVQAWVRATAWLMAIVGVACGVGLWALGVKYALLFALLAGIGEAIPTIGPILSAIPPAMVAFAVEPVQALWMMLLFLVVQQVEQNLLVPRVMATALRLHPVSVLFSVMALGALLGPLGMLLAVPACAVVKVIYREIRRG